MSLDLRRLRYFVAIAEAGSLTRAARLLRIAQPSLSHHLAEIEAHLGTRLMNRSTRGIELTETGQTLLRHGQLVLKEVERAEQAVREQAAEPSGTVTIGLLSSVCMPITPPLLRVCRERFPQIRLLIVEGDSLRLRQAVSSGTLDMAINLGTAVEPPGQPLADEDLFLVGARGTFGGRQGTITLAQALRYPLVLPSFRHGMRLTVEEAAARQRLQVDIAWELEGLGAVRSAVAAGLGCTVMGWGPNDRDHWHTRLSASRIVNPALKRRLVLDGEPRLLARRTMSAVRSVLLDVLRDLTARQVLSCTLLFEPGREGQPRAAAKARA